MLTAAQIDLESIVKAKLPPLPESIVRISSLLQDFDVSKLKIAEAISYDPMLATRILRLANSPLYPFQQKITNLGTAVNAVGNKAIYEIVLVGIIADSFEREIRNSAIGRAMWFHSLSVAIASRELSAMLEMRGTEEAFCCGLLHDIGSQLLFRANPALYTYIFNQSGDDGDILQRESEAYGFDHAEIGAAAAQSWNLSELVSTMILHHHNPSAATQARFMTHVVGVADQLTHLKARKLPVDAEFLKSASVVSLGFNAHQLETAWETVGVQLREIVKTFFTVRQ